MENKSFITTVVDKIKIYSHEYQDYFVKYDYLICSQAFQKKSYYIVQAHEDNYLHLTGVGTSLSPKHFFEKCIQGTLSETDINFNKKGNVTEKQIKGTVRRKIKLLSSLKGIFESGIEAEEDFQKNTIQCSFAVGNEILTLGFTMTDNIKPKSLMKGNELNQLKSKPLDLVFRRTSKQSKFDEILLCNEQSINLYFDKIKNLLSDELINKIENNTQSKENEV